MSPKEAYEYLHTCEFCDSFTGNDETGCEGAPSACPMFRLDRYTAPSWAEEYASLFEPDA